MQLELIKTKKGTWKIISRSNHKNPALKEIAKLLDENNKHNDGGLKIGLYNIGNSNFKTNKSVYSYISKKTNRLNRKQYKSWLEGKRQIVGERIPTPLFEDEEFDQFEVSP